MRAISFSVSDEEHAVFRAEAMVKGLTVAQYCKTAAFSHLSKYGSKGVFAEVVKLLEKHVLAAPDPTDLGSPGNSNGGQRSP